MKIEGIVMGVGVAQDTRNSGKTICCIVLSDDVGFCRIYGIPASVQLSVWGSYSFSTKKGSDYRKESFKHVGVIDMKRKISDKITKRDILNSCILRSGDVDPIDFQNSESVHQSIALVKISHDDCSYSISGKLPKGVAEDGECGWIMTQGKHWLKPYLSWVSQSGKTHNTHLGGREVYEYIRKNPESPFRVFENLGFGPNPDFEHWALLGNQKDRPRTFLCVQLFRLKKQTGGSTPLFYSLNNGRKGDWPYFAQGGANVKTVDRQKLLPFTI